MHLAARPYQESVIPEALQSRFIFGLLEYERSLAQRAGSEIVIGILHQPLYRASVNVHDAMREELAKIQATFQESLPTRIISMETTDGIDLDVLYVAPLRAIPIDQVTSATRALGVLSFTGVPEYVGRGVCVGVRAREGRPHLIVNRAAAQAEGVVFSSELLKVAELIDQEDGVL